MTTPSPRRQARTKTARVLRTERLSPALVRVVLTDVDGLTEIEHSDSYLKLLFPREGVTYPEPFDVAAIRESMPREQWPHSRTYTVRRWDGAELWIDFVVHGDRGVAGPWALKAQPGDLLHFAGPGGAYTPDPEADWHLLAGDESAWPAIAASLEALPEGARAEVLVEVDGPEDEQPSAVPVRWLHRSAGQRVAAAVRELEFPAGRVHAFVHGEAGMVKELRGHLRLERGVARADLSISGYWRIGSDEDGWQAGKAEWNRSVEQEQES
ncbi:MULTISPECIES: siderophore-interacting protein [Actinosynnema]|uniref:siderophore-interacting protein n=1 Tax=Actinosynnema TaxID=40566 RepID=UPI0020A472CE|nr:siderophore-interacting protein [Actinosynnema pretiosum]